MFTCIYFRQNQEYLVKYLYKTVGHTQLEPFQFCSKHYNFISKQYHYHIQSAVKPEDSGHVYLRYWSMLIREEQPGLASELKARLLWQSRARKMTDLTIRSLFLSRSSCAVFETGLINIPYYCDIPCFLPPAYHILH